MFSFLMCFETRLFHIGPEVCDCRSKLKVLMNPAMRWSGSSQKLTALESFDVPANGFECSHTHIHTQALIIEIYCSWLSIFFCLPFAHFFVDIDILRSFHLSFLGAWQVFHLYKGDADNGTLLLSYGFTLSENPYDRAPRFYSRVQSLHRGVGGCKMGCIHLGETKTQRTLGSTPVSSGR